jgi:RNA polymerase sigma-70 factor (ECF subfamily)
MSVGLLTPPSHGSTSASLIDRARRLDADAWRRLSELFGPLVYRWARQAGLQSSDAADVGQEVFRVVAARIGDFRRQRPGDSFRGWLWGITRLKLKEHFRRAAASPRAAGGGDAHQQLQNAVARLDDESADSGTPQEHAEIVQRAVQLIRGDFEESSWQAFWRMTALGHPAAEIAADLGLSPKAVRQAKFRVLKRLRQELAELVDGS